MANLIYPGLGRLGQNVINYLQQELGIPATLSGDNLVISDRHTKQAESRFRALEIHQAVPFGTRPDSEIVADMLAVKPMVAQEWKGRPPTVLSGYGALTDAIVALELTAVARADELSQVLISRVLPLMRGLQAQQVTSVTVDPHAVQGALSITKILCMAAIFGPEDAQRMVVGGHKDRNMAPFDSIFPTAFSWLPFVETLTRFPPYVLTLPVWRTNCAWHFQGAAMWTFHRALCNGLLSEFHVDMSPLVVRSSYLGLAGMEGMTADRNWQYLRLVVISLNDFFAWLANPATFASPDGTVDLLRQMQAFSAVNLLFADLSGLHFHTSAYNRVSYAMSALDKLANLAVNLRAGAESTTGEQAIFKRLCSAEHGQNLKRIFTNACDRKNYSELGAQLGAATERAFKGIGEHFAKQGLTDEASALDIIYSQRNARHGAYLRGEQFKKMFLKAAGSVPPTIASLPFLATLGLITAPREFFANW